MTLRRLLALLMGLALSACASASGATKNRAAAPPAAGAIATTTTRGSSTTITVAPPKGSPPQFIWGYGDPLFCGPPKPEATRQATAAAQGAGPLTLAKSTRSARVVLLGDSSACSLWPGLAAVTKANAIRADQGVVFGCGIVSDEITTTRREAITPHSSRCHGMVNWAMRSTLARTHPTVVIWMSVWEKSDLVVRGKTLVANTPAWTKEINARMDYELAFFNALGARLVMVTEPAPAPNPNRAKAHIDIKADDAGYARLNALLRSFQARHRDKVTLIDLAAKVCPGGAPCPERVEGLRARPDSRHFTPTAAAWAARWLVKNIFPA